MLFNESPFGYHLWYLGAILYVLLIIYLADKMNCRNLLYVFTPFLLMGDIFLGKYSMLFFGRSFPFIWVRNFLFVGLPYFCIGMIIRNGFGKKINSRLLALLIGVFTITTLLERFILVSVNMNGERDHYISTTFLAIAVFNFALEYKGEVNDRLAKIGRYYSSWIYIIHPLFITLFSFIIKRIGMDKLWGYVGPIVVFFSSLLFVAIVSETRKKLIITVSDN